MHMSARLSVHMAVACPKQVYAQAMVRSRWQVAITLITNGPTFQIEKPHYTVQLPNSDMIIDIHKFWFVPARLFRGEPKKDGTGPMTNMKELLLGPFSKSRKATGGFDVSGRSSIVLAW